MKDERKQTLTVGTKIGAAIGFISFLIFGLMPSIYFASYGSLMLMSRLAGGPVEASEQVEQGALARSGGAQDGQEGAPLDLDVDGLERVDRFAAHRERAAQVLSADDGNGHQKKK